MGSDADIEVRRLQPDEHHHGARLVSETMLGSVDPAVISAWAELWQDTAHGAVTADGEVVGAVRWFASDVSLAGRSLPAACVTAVAVRATHRRRGLLRRMMHEQLRSIAEAEVPVSLLVAAEWPIYGRYGYGPSIDACRMELDATAARFTAEPTGSISAVSMEELRPHLEAVHDQRWARTVGAITREARVWDHMVGLHRFPGQPDDLGQRRGAVWRDATGAVRGAVAYKVKEDWTRNRPTGTAEVSLLVGATPEAERELWRFLSELDWVSTVDAGGRPVDDPLPLWLDDGRAAAQLDRSDCIWTRILDLPRTLGARRSPLHGRVVIEVLDDLGYADGRWALELGPDGADVVATSDAEDVRLPVSALGALTFGGTSAERLLHAGWLDEQSPGGVARLDALLHSPVAPWAPTTF